MKLISIEINEFRGIRLLQLTPNGENTLVWGPNGTGKSGVVDAIDFVLTGRIHRLEGKGTDGITLRDHGPHVDHTPEDAYVKAVVAVNNRQYSITRCVDHPAKLEVTPPITNEDKPIFELASRGHGCLSRREILKYVTAQARDRLQEVSAVLSLEDINNVRDAFVRAETRTKKASSTAKQSSKDAEIALAQTAGLATYDEAALLQKVNDCREVLKADSLANLDIDLQSGISESPVKSVSGALNAVQVNAQVDTLRSATEGEGATEFGDLEASLFIALTAIRESEESLYLLRVGEFLRSGRALLEKDECPFCDLDWSADDLRAHIDTKLERASEAIQKADEIDSQAKSVDAFLSRIASSIQNLIAGLTGDSFALDRQMLSDWRGRITSCRQALTSAISRYGIGESARCADFCAPSGIEKLLEAIALGVTASAPKMSPQQASWDTLTRIQSHLTTYRALRTRSERAQLHYRYAAAMKTSYEKARDEVLGKLYDSTVARFSDLYRIIHADDEAEFKAKLVPKPAGLDFKVDFYGRGEHPPHALHSEGHQDSMGLCLYLALLEKLTSDKVDLIVLDDVVMSVDAGHRRHVCRLLAQAFPEKQFVITTHDSTWASQLVAEGVIRRNNSHHLTRWTIDEGPEFGLASDPWQKIEKFLKDGNVNEAAAILRRAMEEFFSLVCHSLRSQVPYEPTGRWELGELIAAAKSSLKKHLAESKKAAQSWGQVALFDELTELDSIRQQVSERLDKEQWLVNQVVHYNGDIQATAADLQPVVDAFKDLQNLYLCTTCNGLLSVSWKGKEPETLRCPCGGVSRNLIAKKA